MMLRTIYENKQKLRARGENTYERMMKKEKDQNLKKKERDLFLKNFMNWKEARKDEEKKGEKGEEKQKEKRENAEKSTIELKAETRKEIKYKGAASSFRIFTNPVQRKINY